MFKHHFFSHCMQRAFMAGPAEGGARSGGRSGRGPFGRHRGGSFGGRGSRMFDSGALRLVVLSLIAADPRHGYDIIKALEERFQGAYSPSPGAIYPMLQMLEEADLVSSATQGNKRLYTITDRGRTHLDEHRTELDKINAQLDEASGEIRESAIGAEIHALRHVLRDKLRNGALTAEQADQLKGILRTAREALDRL